MYMSKLNINLLVILLLALVSESFAGAWTQTKGKAYLQLGTRITIANQFYEPGGRKVDITTLGDYVFSIYGEFGITDNITVFGSFPLLRRLTVNRIEGRDSGTEYFPGDSKTGISDFKIGTRIGLVKFGSTVVSASLAFGIPVGDNEQKNGLYTGDGEFNQHLTLGVGHSFSGPLYVSGNIGFNNRTNGYSDEFTFFFEAGYKFTRSLLVIMKFNGVETLRNGEDETLGGAGGLFANNQRYLALGPEIIYSITNSFGVNAGVVTAAYGENVVSGLAYKLGFYFKLF